MSEPAAARPPPTLGGVVARRIMLLALVAMAIQSVWMLWRYVGDPDHMADHLVDFETGALAKGVVFRDGRARFEPPASVARRYSGDSTGYVARLRDAAGATLWRSCDEACVGRAFAPDAAPAASWMRRTSAGYPLSVAGGHELRTEAGPLYIEVSIDRDLDGVARSVVLEELAEEMLLPTGVALALAIAAALVAIGRSLAPVKEAAALAGRLDPSRPGMRLDPAGMPLEVARLVEAVNRSYARARDLMAAQKLFTAAISHEIRTPLAALRLELEGTDHPRAIRGLAELDELTLFVEQLTALARLEAADSPVTEPVDLAAALRDLTAAVAPWAYDQGASIELAEEAPVRIAGDERLIKSAARNLVENAVRHGGAGVSIVVRVGPGAGFSVEDDGRDGPSPEELGGLVHTRREGGLGVGLEIVRRIAALHDARFEIEPRSPRGVTARLSFPERERDGPATAMPSPRSSARSPLPPPRG